MHRCVIYIYVEFINLCYKSCTVWGTCNHGSGTSFVHLDKQYSSSEASIWDEHCAPGEILVIPLVEGSVSHPLWVACPPAAACLSSSHRAAMFLPPWGQGTVRPDYRADLAFSLPLSMGKSHPWNQSWLRHWELMVHFWRMQDPV